MIASCECWQVLDGMLMKITHRLTDFICMNLILSVNLSLLYIYSSRLFRIQNFEFMHYNIGYGEWFGGNHMGCCYDLRGEKTRVYQIIV